MKDIVQISREYYAYKRLHNNADFKAAGFSQNDQILLEMIMERKLAAIKAEVNALNTKDKPGLKLVTT